MANTSEYQGPARADYGKPTVGYRVFRSSLEPVAPPSADELTPTDAFFVCSVSEAVDMAVDEWAMRIHGEVESSVVIDFARLESLPQHTVVAWLECAGNGRRLFAESAGYEMPEQQMMTPWLLNGMGMATWSGPRLADVLALAGVLPSALWVAPGGHDVDNIEGEAPRMCLPIEKALHEDTIIALTMNDAPLARAHGAPARLLVPGWVGAYSVKWLADLHVSDNWVPSWRADEYYVYRDSNEVATGPITSHPVKSNLAIDLPASLSVGTQRLHGFARSGTTRIVAVEWRINDGAWQPAELGRTLGRWAWQPFSFEVDLTPGEHIVETRAVDEAGSTQPAAQQPHPNGVMWHAITPHRIVAALDAQP